MIEGTSLQKSHFSNQKSPQKRADSQAYSFKISTTNQVPIEEGPGANFNLDAINNQGPRIPKNILKPVQEAENSVA